MAVCAGTVTLRPAAPADDGLLRGLFAGSRPDLAMLPAPTRDVLIDLQFRAQQSQYEAAFPTARRHIIVQDGSAVGQLILDDAAAAVRIVDITIGQPHLGRGIGSAVLREVIDAADASGRPVSLSVWSGNGGAVRLYTRLGFVRVRDDTSDATGYLQMRRDATHQEDD